MSGKPGVVQIKWWCDKSSSQWSSLSMTNEIKKTRNNVIESEDRKLSAGQSHTQEYLANVQSNHFSAEVFLQWQWLLYLAPSIHDYPYASFQGKAQINVISYSYWQRNWSKRYQGITELSNNITNTYCCSSDNQSSRWRCLNIQYISGKNGIITFIGLFDIIDCKIKFNSA